MEADDQASAEAQPTPITAITTPTTEEEVVYEEDEADNWLMINPKDEAESVKIIEEIKKEFKEELDFWDTTMVAEYAEEIFTYMAELEVI